MEREGARPLRHDCSETEPFSGLTRRNFDAPSLVTELL